MKRPKGWSGGVEVATEKIGGYGDMASGYERGYEDGADAILKLLPTNKDIIIKAVQHVYGDISRTEFEEWLNSKMGVRDKI